MKRIFLILFTPLNLLFSDTLYISNGNIINGTIKSLDESSVKIETPDGILEVDKSKIVKGEFSGEGEDYLEDTLFFFQINGDIKDISDNKMPVKVQSIPYTEDRENIKSSALLSKGTGQYFYIEDSSFLNSVVEFTLAMDFYPEDTSKQTFLVSNWYSTYKNGKAVGRFSLSVLNRDVVFFIVDGNGNYQSIVAGKSLELKSWNKLAVRYNRGEVSIFVNGETVAESSFTNNKLFLGDWPIYFMTSKYAFKDGKTDMSMFNIKGKLDKIRMLGFSLSDNELNSLF